MTSRRDRLPQTRHCLLCNLPSTRDDGSLFRHTSRLIRSFAPPVPASAVSEAYFSHTVPNEWTFSPTDVRQKAADKAYTLLSRSNGNLVFSEFGTRRRRSWEVQKLVLEGLMEGEKRFWAEVGGRNGKKGGLIGTSNVSR